MSKHVLLAGFEPYGDHKVSPSELLVRSLEGRLVGGRLIAVRVLPSESRSLKDRLQSALNAEQPEVVVGLAYAPGRTALAVERIGVNLVDFSRPDAVGAQRTEDAVERGGVEARVTTIPAREIVESWHKNGVPGYVSHNAGTELGNQFLYEALTLCANKVPPVAVGLISLPALPGLAIELGDERTPSMSLDLMRKGIETLVETVSTWLDARPEPVAPRGGSTPSVWIPRGLREVER